MDGKSLFPYDIRSSQNLAWTDDIPEDNVRHDR